MREKNYKYLEDSIAKSRKWGNLRYAASICAMAFALIFFSAVVAIGSSQDEIPITGQLPSSLISNQQSGTGQEISNAEDPNAPTEADSLQVADTATLSDEELSDLLVKDAAQTAAKYPEATTHISNPNVDSDFDILWTPTGSTIGITTPVKYVGQKSDGSTIDIPAFQTETLYLDYINSGFISGSSGKYNYNENMSEFDIYYYQEPIEQYESGVKHIYSFSGCYIEDVGSNTKHQFTKLAYASNNTSWYVKNDLKVEGALSSWTQCSDFSSNNYQIVVNFKDVTPAADLSPTDNVDLKASWAGSVSADVSFVYSYKKPESFPTGVKKLNSAFAYDLYFDLNAVMTMADFCKRYVEQDIDGLGSYDECVYNTSYLSYKLNDGTTGTVEIRSVKYNNSTWTYVNSSGSSVALNNVSYIHLYFLYCYETTETSPTAKKVNTANTASKGVEINLFDYSAWFHSEKYSSDRGGTSIRYSGGINSFSDFWFSCGETGTQWMAPDGSSDPRKWNIWRDSVSGWFRSWDLELLWKEKLVNGYPEMKEAFQIDGCYHNLNYLLDPNRNDVKYKKTYKNLNHLFLEDNGHLKFDSSKNFAQIRKKPDGVDSSEANDDLNKDFTVYNTATTNDAEFMPFDEINTSNTSNNDFLFGMTINSHFKQPEGGKYLGEDMVFTFTGDDDVYVYIDDALVLDLGCIHDKIKGTINFATGDVNRYESGTGGTLHDTNTLKQLFSDAGVEAKDGWNGNTFATTPDGGTPHEMKMYYFERGKGQSNFSIDFNLDLVPYGDLQIGKKVDGKKDIVGDIDGDFHYKISANNGTAEEPNWVDFSGIYKVYNGSLEGEHVDRVCRPEDHGDIWINRDQIAVINDYYEEDTVIRCVEKDPRETVVQGIDYTKLKWVVKFIVNGVDVDPTTIKINNIDYYGKDNLTVGKQAILWFKNIVSDIQDNLFSLHVNKVGTNDSDTTIRINFNGGESIIPGEEGKPIDFIPYGSDEYFEESGGGPYTIYNSDWSKDHDGKTQNGEITFSDGQTIVIPNVQMDTKVVVETLGLTNKQKSSYQVTPFMYGFFEPGMMTPDWSIGSSPNWAETALCSAFMPFVEKPADLLATDKYGEIRLKVDSLANNLTFKKIVDASETSHLTDLFTISGLLRSGGTLYSTDEIFVGKKYDTEFDDPTVYDVKVENGEVKVSDVGDDNYSYPVLMPNEYLVIEGILPKTGEGVTVVDEILGFEKKVTNCTATLTLDDLGTASDMYIDYPEEGGDYLTTQAPSTIMPGIDHTFTIKNTFSDDPPPTALDLFKHPETWTLLLALLLMACAAAPIQIVRKARSRKAHAISHSLNIHEIFFEI